MFNCESPYNCDAKPSAPGEPSRRVVLETRPRDYRDRQGGIIGRGFEIVREAVYCESCKAKLEK